MKKLISLIAMAGLAAGGVGLAGCQPQNNNAPAFQQNPNAGGNGAFGESPANPGEHSGQQFRKDTGANPSTQPNSAESSR